MKEKNKKLISEVIKDIEHDMTDEEILSLLASSKVSETRANRQRMNTRSASAWRIK